MLVSGRVHFLNHLSFRISKISPTGPRNQRLGKSGGPIFPQDHVGKLIENTLPKTNGWIPKMMVWKRYLCLKMDIFGINSLDFWGVHPTPRAFHTTLRGRGTTDTDTLQTQEVAGHINLAWRVFFPCHAYSQSVRIYVFCFK